MEQNILVYLNTIDENYRETLLDYYQKSFEEINKNNFASYFSEEVRMHYYSSNSQERFVYGAEIVNSIAASSTIIKREIKLTRKQILLRVDIRAYMDRENCICLGLLNEVVSIHEKPEYKNCKFNFVFNLFASDAAMYGNIINLLKSMYNTDEFILTLNDYTRLFYPWTDVSDYEKQLFSSENIAQKKLDSSIRLNLVGLFIFSAIVGGLFSLFTYKNIRQLAENQYYTDVGPAIILGIIAATGISVALYCLVVFIKPDWSILFIKNRNIRTEMQDLIKNVFFVNSTFIISPNVAALNNGKYVFCTSDVLLAYVDETVTRYKGDGFFWIHHSKKLIIETRQRRIAINIKKIPETDIYQGIQKLRQVCNNLRLGSYSDNISYVKDMRSQYKLSKKKK